MSENMSTFGNDIEIDWNRDDGTTPAKPQPPQLTTNTSAQLVESEREVAKEYGFKHDDSKLFYVPGTELAESGLERSQKYAAEYAALPGIALAASQHRTTVMNELRRDRNIRLSDWRLDSSGLLSSTLETKSATLSDTAWAQLGLRHSEIPAPLCSLSLEVNAARVAARSAPKGNVNAWIGAVTGEVKSRVRTVDGARQIFAIVSSGARGYTAYDSDAVMADLARAMPDTKCQIEYDPATTRLRARAYIQAPVDISAFVGVGRVHRAGVQLTTRDDGMMALTGRAFIERVRCKNHTLVEEKQGEIRRRHVGDYAQLRAQINTLVGRMPAMIDALRGLWSRAAAEYYLDSESGIQLSAPEAITRLVVHGHVPTGGLEEKDAIAAYTNAWRVEDSPHSAAGVLMAVQRAAHETTWRTKWSSDEIESAASELLYQPVYALASHEHS